VLSSAVQERAMERIEEFRRRSISRHTRQH
jgi:hypothetical protein